MVPNNTVSGGGGEKDDPAERTPYGFSSLIVSDPLVGPVTAIGPGSDVYVTVVRAMAGPTVVHVIFTLIFPTGSDPSKLAQELPFEVEVGASKSPDPLKEPPVTATPVGKVTELVQVVSSPEKEILTPPMEPAGEMPG